MKFKVEIVDNNKVILYPTHNIYLKGHKIVSIKTDYHAVRPYAPFGKLRDGMYVDIPLSHLSIGGEVE